MVALMSSRVYQRRNAGAIAWVSWILAAGGILAAAERAPAPRTDLQPLDFSDSAASQRLLPESARDPAQRNRLEFLNQRSSMGGVLSGPGEFSAPVNRAPGAEARSAGRGSGRLDFEELWQNRRPGESGPSAADFERAAGVRSAAPSNWGGQFGSAGADSGPAAARAMNRSSMDLSDGGLDAMPNYDMRRSLDPVLDFRLPGASPGRAGAEAMVAPGFLPRSLEAAPRSALRPDFSDPLEFSSSDNLITTPRTVRDLIQPRSTPRESEPSRIPLDRDTTRDEFNPYTPRWRDDFQFPLGDSRLGINASVADPGSRRSGPAATEQTYRTGPSSLSPALALPIPDPVTVPNRRGSQTQFPSRRF